MGFATTMYCDKCGKTWVIFPPYTNSLTICNICENTIKPIPNEYFENLSNEGLLLSPKMQEKLINDLVLTSPNFDQYYFDNKDEIQLQQNMELSAKMQHGKVILENKNCIPKCPTCNSTNIQKISGTAKVTGAVTFGLFSKTARSQFKCKDCGYKW